MELYTSYDGMATIIQEVAWVNMPYLKKDKIGSILKVFSFLKNKKKVFDAEIQKVRAYTYIKREQEYECKSSTALVKALLPNSKIMFVSQNGNTLNHVANFLPYQNMVIDGTIQQKMPLKEYLIQKNIHFYLLY